MIEGPSGILSISHPHFMPSYNKVEKQLTWPNGATANVYTDEAYESLRGPNFDAAWVDELFKFRSQEDTWEQLRLATRLNGPLGHEPRIIITSTPRTTPLLKEIRAEEDTIITYGSTYDNPSLSKKAVELLEKKYGGTRVGRQELMGEMLEDNPSALFHQENIDAHRVKDIPDLQRIVVAIDPAVTSNAKSDETGICVAGIGYDGHGYILHDGTLKATPYKWSEKAVALYKKYSADLIVGEANNGGQLIEDSIRNIDKTVNYKKVTATRGKTLRAEPISALYEQGKIHHVGHLAEMEDEICQYDPTLKKQAKSPGRLDSMVWALTELFGSDINEPIIWTF